MTKKKTPTKPKPKSRLPEFDFNDCTNYIEQKYGYSTRDYAGQFRISKTGKILSCNEGVPYQDFWHWVTEVYDIHNGCNITFSQETLDSYKPVEGEPTDGCMEDWQIKIYQDYLNEFADENGEINFYVWW